MSRNLIEDFLIWVLGLIAAFALFIFRSIVREIWLLIKLPFEMIFSLYQMIIAFEEFLNQIQILHYAIDILGNLTSQPLLQGIFLSISPLANLIWLLFGGYIFFKFVLPAIVEAL